MVQPMAYFLLQRINKLFVLAVLLSSTGSSVAAQNVGLEIADFEIKQGEEHILWKKSIKLANGAEIKNAIVVGEACYFASAAKGEVRLLKIDRDGKTRWERKLDSGRQRGNVILIPRSLDEADSDNGIDVAFPNVTFGNTRIASFDGEGKSLGEINLVMSRPTNAVRLNNGDLLFFGSTPYNTREKPKGFATRINTEYETVWEKSYSPSAEFPKERLKMIHGASFSKAIILPDDTIALIGQAGIYSKFGTGESRLWILKIDNEGNRIAEKSVGESYFNAHSNFPVQTNDSELLVSHWKVSGNPFAETDVEDDEPKGGLWPWISRFDVELNVIATHELGEKLPPGTATAGGFQPSIFPMLGASMYGDNLLLRHANERGIEVQRVEISQPDSSLIHWSKLDFPRGTLWVISERERRILHLVMVESP